MGEAPQQRPRLDSGASDDSPKRSTNAGQSEYMMSRRDIDNVREVDIADRSRDVRGNTNLADSPIFNMAMSLRSNYPGIGPEGVHPYAAPLINAPLWPHSPDLNGHPYSQGPYFESDLSYSS